MILYGGQVKKHVQQSACVDIQVVKNSIMVLRKIIFGWCPGKQMYVITINKSLHPVLRNSSMFSQMCKHISLQATCAIWELIVLLIGKKYSCPWRRAINILWWNRFHALPSGWTGHIWGWNPSAGESHPQCKRHSHFPWPWSLGKHNYLNPIIWNTKGLDQKTLQLYPRSAVCEIECDACLASVCICGGVNEATVTCLLLAVWLIILWCLLLPHGARPVWVCGRPGTRASSISPLHRRSKPARHAPVVGWIADASHCPPPSSSVRAITCLGCLMEMGTLCKGRGQRWFLCIEFL